MARKVLIKFCQHRRQLGNFLFWLSFISHYLATKIYCSESHGLDEALIRNSINMKAETNRLSVCNTSSSNPSSSHSPSVCGEQFDVKVEITPPQPLVGMEPPCMLPKSFSNESTSTLSVDYQSKTTSSSPQQRKFSEITDYAGLLGTMGNRLNAGTTSNTPASSRFFKRIEELIDLSSPYNHYKCLSPSETNLTQFNDARTHAFTHRADPNKPGSGKMLRRQFSLDKGKLHACCPPSHTFPPN